MSSESIVVGLDIGTTKIAAVVGQVDQYGKVNIVGVGQHPSQGLRRGVVINQFSGPSNRQNYCVGRKLPKCMPESLEIIFGLSTAKV
ncbi:MAG: hypothetical protein P8Y99_03010 [Calditrichaceae bacterium]